jgi:hypothetical protein
MRFIAPSQSMKASLATSQGFVLTVLAVTDSPGVIVNAMYGHAATSICLHHNLWWGASLSGGRQGRVGMSGQSQEVAGIHQWHLHVHAKRPVSSDQPAHQRTGTRCDSNVMSDDKEIYANATRQRHGYRHWHGRLVHGLRPHAGGDTPDAIYQRSTLTSGFGKDPAEALTRQLDQPCSTASAQLCACIRRRTSAQHARPVLCATEMNNACCKAKACGQSRYQGENLHAP